ncbi:uncharacterized protein B0I36DRAFT_245408 [Microdochium trichocladiopsis]|uniref:Uncharacterized protein n=1 Tax=Microdochium trichocladiopsis TaxID=1682393 RepID=A0A9P8Y2M9_9PEZI|nr:uncharacterized protein B0I36DRAFT_245408 [Microdochium trichocladiopsis]KAH7029309.1 hypothetical protein B0I36DRAFT_245408 [Microdochium trichocladiopsis]
MDLLLARDLLAWPPGDNDTDTIIDGVHFNLTTLKFWNYTYWSNKTLSNVTWCELGFQPYLADTLLENGTWVNSTSCYVPLDPIGTRSAVGMGYAVAYALCLLLVLVNLTKHGKLHLPSEKRFVPIGRRWQWYWAIWVCATAMIGLFFNVDVDRYYVMEIPILITSFFWYLMQMGTTALVWEAVRHWGSWMERQYIDPNPFVLPEEGRRWHFEFWVPLFFYFWDWMNFFMVIPRNWSPIERQRAPDQVVNEAEPNAMDPRFKAATFMLFICWLTIVVYLQHAVRHYEAKHRGAANRVKGFFSYMPWRFILEIPLLLALVVYQGIAAWDFDLSPLKVNTYLPAVFVGGYTPSLLILIIQIIDGFMRPNEDRELIRQRRVRGAAVDQELGYVQKPAWWHRNAGADDMANRIMRNVREVGGGRATATRVDDIAQGRAVRRDSSLMAAGGGGGGGIEMSPMASPGGVGGGTAAPPPYTPYAGKSERRKTEHAMQAAAAALFPQPSNPASAAGSVADMPPPPEFGAAVAGTDGDVDDNRQAGMLRPRSGERNHSTASSVSVSQQRPQQVRSMLDV